jgi:hypothetical protein
MKRRTFIYFSLIGTAAITIPGLSCSNNNYKEVIQRPQFLSHICDPTMLSEIGKSYRDKLRLNDAELLESKILKGTDGKLISRNTGKNFLISFIDKKIKDDFEEGKTLVIKGWVISETEAQQCALFSLTEPKL